jgi:hypothetical protein
MRFLQRICGFDALSRRIDEITAAVDNLAERVTEVERRIQPSIPYGCRDWEAWHDRMPGTQPTLYVRGWCTFPSEAYEVRLERHEPQGINPRDLLLDLIIREPSEPVPQVLTDKEVRYEEQTDSVYESVTILPNGPTVRVTAATYSPTPAG